MRKLHVAVGLAALSSVTFWVLWPETGGDETSALVSGEERSTTPEEQPLLTDPTGEAAPALAAGGADATTSHPAGTEQPTPAALPPLAAAWRQAVVTLDREQVVRGALALRQAPDGEGALLLLVADPQPRVRAYALRELGRRRNPALRATFEALRQDPSPAVRENAAWALGQLTALGPLPEGAR